MIKEAITAIGELAVAAAGTKTIRPEAEPKHVYYLNGERKVADPWPRDNRAFDLAAIVKLAKLGFATEENDNYEVWYSSAGVTAILDRNERLDLVRMELTWSEQLLEINKWQGDRGSFSQRDLILLLRTRFKYCMRACPDLLKSIRNLRFSSASKAEAAITHGKASISRSIETEVSGAQELPEDFVLTVPIFCRAFPQMEGKIEVALDMDATKERLILYPLASSIDTAISKAEQRIGEMLAEQLEPSRVLYGRP